jgi:GDP-L-fucose synthase
MISPKFQSSTVADPRLATESYHLAGKRIWVAGHRGMVGQALCRRLKREAPREILSAPRAELDLTDQAAVRGWMAAHKPDCIFLAAAKVGGIGANAAFPADFLFENLAIAQNIIHAAHENGTEKLLFLGSSCIYPKFAAQPISEDALLTGALEPTNEAYALAKIAGLKLCAAYKKQYGDNFISAMPTNLYGPGDHYDLENSHVIPALILKAHRARMENAPDFEIWGTGEARREFLHVDDCADGLVHLMKTYSGEAAVNLGTGADITIKETAQAVMKAVGFQGQLTHDLSKPDGTPRKQLDTRLMTTLGWTPSISFSKGLAGTYADYLRRFDPQTAA